MISRDPRAHGTEHRRAVLIDEIAVACYEGTVRMSCHLADAHGEGIPRQTVVRVEEHHI